ncbi:MAG: hypothetical protein E7170_03760 [Firmicutes bacterium]|nr:hypothetical protein [Bacillota bacterium]
MYEERNSFSLRTLILQFLAVVLFVFILIWLFPTKSYMEENYVSNDEVIDKLQSIYGRNFADNVESMRDAAKGYFTNERMPQKVGESVTLTLGEMLEKKLVLQFIDSNGQKCDSTKSYVKLTKMENEYQLKVQLTCTDYSDYIIDYIGCYDYCNECGDKTPTTTPTKKPTPTPSSKEYLYQYRLTTQNVYSNWSAWSVWTTAKVTADELKQVEKEDRKEVSGYTTEKKIVGYKTETYTVYEERTVTKYKTETYTDYETKQKTVPDGTETKLVDSVNPTVTQGYYTAWVNAGTKVTKDQVLTSTNTTQYTLQSTNRYLDCENKCRYITERTYTVKTRKYVEGTSTCPSGYKPEGSKCNKYETVTKYKTVTEKVPVTKTREVPYTTVEKVPVTKTREVPIYEEVKTPIYKTVTYYRFRTRTLVKKSETIYKMSKSKNDQTLISQGYVYTGYFEEV